MDCRLCRFFEYFMSGVIVSIAAQIFLVFFGSVHMHAHGMHGSPSAHLNLII